MRSAWILCAIGMLVCFSTAHAAVVSSSLPADADWNTIEYMPGELLVKFYDGVTDAAAYELHTQLGCQRLCVSEYVDFDRVSIPEGHTVEEMVAAYEVSPLVEYAEPNYIARIMFIPNDTHYSKQWGPECIGAEKCWDVEKGNHSVIVSVIDTGCDMDHPDLNGNVDKSIDYDFVNNDGDASDDFGHGTHCCGIVAAEINNSQGIAGLSQVKLMVVKVMDWLGMGTMADIVAGINYSVNNGARVISMSLGSTSSSSSLKNACDNAYNSGVLVVAAAGNSNTSQKTYPAAYTSVIGVAALDDCTHRATYSNYGWDNVELAAPGTQIYSTMPTYIWFTLYFLGYSTNYDYMDGTSMACPHVAGVGGAYFSHRPSLTNKNVRNHMKKKADDLGASGRDQYYGYGRVDMYPFEDYAFFGD
jgi:thermitase